MGSAVKNVIMICPHYEVEITLKSMIIAELNCVLLLFRISVTFCPSVHKDITLCHLAKQDFSNPSHVFLKRTTDILLIKKMQWLPACCWLKLKNRLNIH